MIMAGGTGGHVFPALAIADALKEAGEQVIWMGTKKGLEARVVPQAGYSVEWLSVNGLRGKGTLTLLLTPFKLLQALVQAAKILAKHKPKAVLGMGGFVSGPGGIMAWLMRVPLFIHEQNSVVGLTNQWLSKVCTQLFYGFPNPLKSNKQGLYVGNPVRAELLNLKAKNSKTSFNLLIVGGSLGAEKLNRTVPNALALLNNDRVNVIHQCGERHLEMTKQAYKEVTVQHDIKPFIDDMKQAYEWADFIVCRSGALTIAEITNIGLASILVPYPYAVDDHQTTNAALLKQAGATYVIDDKNINATALAELLETSFLNETKRDEMAKLAKSLAKPQATQDVVEKMLQVVNS